MNFLPHSSYFCYLDSSYDSLCGYEDGSFTTESTDIWIFESRNLYVEVCMLCDVGVVCGCTYLHFILMAFYGLFSTFSVLHCLLPSSCFSLSFKGFFLNQYNDLS